LLLLCGPQRGIESLIRNAGLDVGVGEILLLVQIRRGDARAELFASDLGHGYVSVNADYRT
jgi:N-acetylglutamate synthase/N-acetylornithine aminotransferase